MIFNKIRIEGRSTIEIPIYATAVPSPYLLRDMSGLGSVAVTVNVANGFYQGGEPLERQMVFNIDLKPNYALGETVTVLRQAFYGLLSNKKTPVVTRFMLDAVEVAFVEGWVSKVEPTPFGKDSILQLVIDTATAYLQAPAPVVLAPVGDDPVEVESIGTAPSGFTAKFTITDTAEGFAVRVADEIIFVIAELQADDEITVVTTPGSKDVYRAARPDEIAEGFSRISLLALIESVFFDSVWPSLYKGENLVEVVQAPVEYTGTTDLALPFTWTSLEYLPLYWGG